MELTFIVEAIRRYLWVVVVLTVLGLIGGLMLGGDDEVLYESEAVLLVSAPVDDRGLTVDPDRYVAGQISVLSSEGMAERVIARLDDGTERSTIARSVSIEHEVDTDIVHLIVATPDPERSQLIGAAYVAEYFDSLRQQVDNTQEPELAMLNEEVETLREQMEENDEAREQAMAPYRDRENPPSPEAVMPHLMTEDRLLNYRMQSTLEALSDLDTSARLRLSSEVVQQATLPTDPVPPAPNLMLGVGLIGGFGGGLFAAVALARLSLQVIGDDQAEEIMGYPVVGRLPTYPRARHDRAQLLADLPRSIAGFVGGLTVRAEAVQREGQSLAVAVIAPRKGAGSTTLATMVARRFADAGSRVLLVDADRHNPELRSLFMVDQTELPSKLPARDDLDGSTPTDSEVLAFQPSDLPNLYVSDLRTLAGTSRLRPAQLAEAIERASAAADVVVFDAGSLLGAATTMHLTRACDVVMLAVPQQQDARELHVVASEIRGRAVLPVWTPAKSGNPLTRLPVVGPMVAKRVS